MLKRMYKLAWSFLVTIVSTTATIGVASDLAMMQMVNEYSSNDYQSSQLYADEDRELYLVSEYTTVVENILLHIKQWTTNKENILWEVTTSYNETISFPLMVELVDGNQLRVLNEDRSVDLFSISSYNMYTVNLSGTYTSLSNH